MAGKTYQDSYFGSLVYDEKMLAWIGEFSIDRWHKIAVEFDGEDENDLETVEKSKLSINKILERENEFRLNSATQLSDSKDGKSIENLYSKLSIKSICFSDDESVAIEYDNGDLFSKKSIIISVDRDGNLEDFDVLD